MNTLQSIALLLTFASLNGYINHRWFKLPTVLGMTLSSVCFSILLIIFNKEGWINMSGIAEVINVFDFKKLVLHGLLALLLFSGSLFVDISALRKWAGPIVSLSTIGVIVSATVTGGLVWGVFYLIGYPIPLIMSFLFGVLISPTDPIAALAIVKKIGAPKSLEIKLVGESLFNDGVGVLFFLILLGLAQSQSIGFSDIAIDVLWAPLVAAFLGVSLGWITLKALSGIDDYAIEILITLALAVGSYSLAETLHASAPITTVVAGLMISRKTRKNNIISEKTRERIYIFWESIDEIINASLFALIGLELIVLDVGLKEAAWGLMAWICVLVGRWIGVKISLLFFNKSPGTQKILTWGGLRGGISLALVLTIPPPQIANYWLQ